MLWRIHSKWLGEVYSANSHSNSLLNHVQLFATPWTSACLALLPMGFPRQEYRSGLPFPSPGDLPDSGIEPVSPASQVGSLPTEPPENTQQIFIEYVSWV